VENDIDTEKGLLCGGVVVFPFLTGAGAMAIVALLVPSMPAEKRRLTSARATI